MRVRYNFVRSPRVISLKNNYYRSPCVMNQLREQGKSENGEIFNNNIPSSNSPQMYAKGADQEALAGFHQPSSKFAELLKAPQRLVAAVSVNFDSPNTICRDRFLQLFNVVAAQDPLRSN